MPWRCGALTSSARCARPRTLKAGIPTPRLALRDPLAVRALVVVLVVATFIAAGGERMRRIAAAFDWQGVMLPANFRIDAWVNPPTYTGKPPLILQGLRPGEPVQAAAAVSVPAGSTLVIRATGIPLDVVASGGLCRSSGAPHNAISAKGTEERRFVINDAGAVTVRGAASRDVTWQFTAIPDQPADDCTRQGSGGAGARQPATVLQARGRLRRRRRAGDLQLAQQRWQRRWRRAARALYEAPDFPLVLPQARTRNGAGQTTKDLTEHPWAGVDVAMTLTARDEAGNEGRSEPFEMRLPERPFCKPMARALIEQRRLLALDGDAQANVLTALDALTLAPERFQHRDQRLSRIALDLLAAFPRQER